MSENKSPEAKVEKICLDNECSEAWEKQGPDFSNHIKGFIYCPFCSEELLLQCSCCKETLASKDYKFCPWCGAKFEQE